MSAASAEIARLVELNKRKDEELMALLAELGEREHDSWFRCANKRCESINLVLGGDDERVCVLCKTVNRRVAAPKGWKCEACMHLNANPAARECEVCFADRDDGGESRRASHDDDDDDAGKWKCEACMHLNADPTARECKVCFADRDGGDDADAKKWKCEACMWKNDPAATMCAMCFEDRPQFTSAVSFSPPISTTNNATWRCAACTHINSSSTGECVVCYADRPGEEEEQQQQVVNNSWKCSACTSLVTDPNATECPVCFADREEMGSSRTAGWRCPACTTQNDDETSTECRVCYSDRPVESEGNADTLTLDFSADGKRENLALNPGRVHELLSPLETMRGTVRILRLSGKSFSVDAARAVAERLKRMTGLRGADFADVIAGQKEEVGLEVLTTLCGPLESLPELKELDLSDNALGEKGVRALSTTLAVLSSWGIESLTFKNNGLSAKSMELLLSALGEPRALKKLCFTRNMSGDAGATVMARFIESHPGWASQLEEFTMAGCRVRSEGGAAICGALPRLTSLSKLDLSESALGGATAGGGKLVEALRSPALSRLVELNLRDCGVEDRATLGQLMDLLGGGAMLPRLEVLDLSTLGLGTNRVRTFATSPGYRDRTALRVLRLAENEIEDESVFSALAENAPPALEVLDVSQNGFSDFDALSNAGVALFRTRPGLQRLELGGNDAVESEETERAFVASLARGIGENEEECARRVIFAVSSD